MELSKAIPQGYKQTEVGVIPEDWSVETLANLIEYTKGYAFKSQDYSTDGKRIIRVSDTSYDSILNENPVFISEQHPFNFSKWELKTDDLIITTVGSKPPMYNSMVGKVIQVSSSHSSALLNQNAVIIRDKKNRTGFNALLLNHMRTQRYLLWIESIFRGNANQASITLNDLFEFSIPFPSSDKEQQAIATALSDIDALLAQLDALIAKKRDLKQAAMQQLLTAQIRLPGFSGEWEEKTFGELFEFLPTATNSRSDLINEGNAYYIHYGDIHTRFHSHIDFELQQPSMILREKCSNAALLKNGDWVMADASEDYAGVGKSIEVLGLKENQQAVAGLHTFLLREKTPTFTQGFKGHLGNLESLHQQYLRVATGMKVFGVSKNALKNLVLKYPLMEEQTAIATVLSDMDAEITALEARRDKTRALKQGMMQELLTGKTRLIPAEENDKL